MYWEVIEENQNASVERRQILDAVMVANEIIDDLVGQNKEGVICKIDVKKAYNHVCWDFVNYILEQMGFGCKWKKWVMLCISTTSFAVMVNAGPSNFFKASRDLRQGDPVLPLLFLTVMEAFNRLTDRTGELNVVKSIMVGSGETWVRVSYLFLADNALIFCEPDLIALLHLRCILLCFQMVLALKLR